MMLKTVFRTKIRPQRLKFSTGIFLALACAAPVNAEEEDSIEPRTYGIELSINY